MNDSVDRQWFSEYAALLESELARLVKELQQHGGLTRPGKTSSGHESWPKREDIISPVFWRNKLPRWPLKPLFMQTGNRWS